MAKIYGLFGAMSGKVADVVMSVRNGQQIVRKYQPVVANPKTVNQYTTRARFKLISQLSAIMAPVIAIPKVGGVSSRNLFTKINFPISSFSNNEANIVLTDVQLTSSVVALPNLTISRDAASITISLLATPGILDIDRVVYALFMKETDGTLRLRNSTVISERGEENVFTAQFQASQVEHLALAYGIRDNNQNASLYFGNLIAPTAEDVAKLIVSRTLKETDITLTMTQGIVLAAGSSKSNDDDDKISKSKIK